MSYCRWSSDDFKCDVYVYEDVAGGFTTHVAGNRVVYTKELPPPLPHDATPKEWLERHDKVSKIYRRSKRVPIGLPFDDQSFNDDTAKECAERLIKLKEIGYNVPQYAIDALLAE